MPKWFTRIFGAVAGAILLVGSSTSAALAASVGSQNFQAVVVSNGELFHALRYSSDGAWNGFNNLTRWATVPGGVRQASAAGGNGGLHVLITTQGPYAQVYHAIRYPGGGWAGFNNVAGWATVPASTWYAAAAASVNGDLHALLLTGGPDNSGFLYHAIRYSSDGHWNGFNLVSAFTSVPGPVDSVAATGIGGNLHVLITSGGNLYHAIRYPSGAWTGFNNVSGWASVPGPSTGRAVGAVTAASVNGNLHVVIAVGGDELYHAIRYSSNGAWVGFNNLASHASVPSGVVCLTAAGVNSDLQVLVATSSGQIYHALRSSSTGAWNGFNHLMGNAYVPNFPTACGAGA